MKDTALASVVAMPDLLKQATQAQALAANPTPLIAAALIYLVILLPLVRLVGRLEARGRASAGDPRPLHRRPCRSTSTMSARSSRRCASGFAFFDNAGGSQVLAPSPTASATIC